MYYITADATSDFPESYPVIEFFDKIPMPYTIDDEEYEHYGEKSLSIEQFNKKMLNGGMPSTSCIAPHKAKEFWTKILDQDKDILHIAFSSGLSSSYNNLCLAAQELQKEYPDRKFILIDSLCAGIGEATLIHYAINNRKNNMSIEDNAKEIEAMKMNLCHYFVVNDLFHLKRGGRISQFTAIVGTAIQLKPILQVDNKGKLINIDKVISRRMALKNLLLKVQSKATDKTDTIFLSHGNCLEDAEFLKTKLESIYPNSKIYINKTGPILLSHTGLGFLGVTFLGKDR